MSDNNLLKKIPISPILVLLIVKREKNRLSGKKAETRYTTATLVLASSKFFIYIYINHQYSFSFKSDNEKKVTMGWGEAGTSELQG